MKNYQYHLDRYREGRGYPIEDDALMAFIERLYRGGSFLILNAQNGLLGQRIIDRQGVTVVGIEPDAVTVRQSMDAGIRMQSHGVELNDFAHAYLAQMFENYGTTALIIRDCEETLADVDWLEFVTVIERSNVRELFIEGPKVIEQCRRFDPPFRLEEKVGDSLAYMRSD